MKNKILIEITNYCECCLFRESCLEDKCILFRIKNILVGGNNEKQKE